jgi:tRNA(Ile2) C34 agmatinyltransferase TiaS
MPHAVLPTNEDIISDILNWVCPGCGGRMGGRTQEFKCQSECRTDWRDVWERRLAKPLKNRNSPQAPSKLYKDYATAEAAREVFL